MENVNTTFANIRNLSYDYIESNVIECDSSRILYSHHSNQNTISLFKNKPLKDDITKFADILVGFVAHENIEFEIVTHKIIIARYNLWKRQFVYAIEDNYILPIICTRFEVLQINIIKGSLNDISIVFGCIHDTDMRRFVAMNDFQTGHIYFGHGMCSDKPYNTYHIFPKMRDETTLQEYMNMANERTVLLLEDIAKEAWNPSRIRMWCLPFDDDFAINERTCKSFHKLWLDDILLIDGFDFKYQISRVVGATISDDKSICFESFNNRSDVVAPTTLQISNNEKIFCNIHELLSQQNMNICGQVRYISYQTSEGMHLHKDNSLEGGTHTFIVYLDDNTAGHICFKNNNVKIIPRRNRCLIFDVEIPHWVEPCHEPKRIITGECAFKY